MDCITTSFQPGGNILTSTGKSACRVLQSGVDDRNLGRWCWTRYNGKRNVSLVVICAYRPCKPTTFGVSTAYCQHQRFFDQQNLPLEPRQAFLDDMAAFIRTCHDNNDQIILMMDCNEPVSSPSMRRWLQSINMTEAIASFHNLSEGPATYHRGSKQIDGIFISNTIHPLRCGFLPFGELPSDHRPLWLDISFDNAFGYKMEKIVIPKARRLKSDDPKIRNRWIELMKGEVLKRKLHEKAFYIEANMTIPLSDHLAKEYDALLSQRRLAIEYADKHCRKLNMGHVEFSPDVSKAGATIALWKAVLTKKRRAKYSQSKLRRLEKKAGISNSMHRTVAEAESQLKTAIKEYKKLKKNAKLLRKSFLQEKADALAKESNGDATNVYKQLMKREQQRTSARSIKYALNKIQGGGVTRVEVIDDDSEIAELTTKEDIERACMRENKAKYLQTNNTPCMNGTLFRDLGIDGNTPAGREILDGTYRVPADSPQYAQEFFDQLSIPEIVRDSDGLSNEISTTDFQQGWKMIKERTSAGISGLHFGHMKTCAKDRFLSEFESSIAQIPFATGYSPSSWRYGISVMIHKKAGVDLVTKLRTITLLEADFNFNNKVLGRRTLQHAEKLNLIAKEQYGSRPGKSAIDHAFHKRLTYDIIRQCRIPGALCSNDAKSCFDRIIHAIVCLAYERLGVKQPPVHCMVKSIQQMKHHIRTTFGDSAFTMSSDGYLIPFQGVLQGNGASPASWVVISSPLLNMIRAADGGGHFVSAISKESNHMVGYAFVDDTDLIQVDMRNNSITIEDTMQRMQATIDRWECGLKLTGGAIVPEKSWVYPIAFEFDNQGKWTYKDNESIEHDFTVKDLNHERRPLQTLSPSTGKCTLGVILAPDGNNNDAIEDLRKKTEKWRDLIKVGHIDKLDAWTAMETTIMKTIQYPAVALTLTEKEWAYVMAPILEAGLPKSAIVRTFPRKVLYGPKEEGGLNKLNPYLFQGTAQIALLTEHLALSTMTGELLRTSIESAKVELGLGGNLFTNNYARYGCLLTESVVKNIWKFAHEHRIQIEDNITSCITLQRDDDKFLMEALGDATPRYSSTKLQHLNRCRLYLQVSTLSDIVDGFGRRITDDSIKCIIDKEIPHRYIYPQQSRPNDNVRRLWKRALKYTFARYSATEQSRLRQPLGFWRFNSDDWIWYYNCATQMLYQKRAEGHTWKAFRRLTRGGNIGINPVFTYSAEAFQLPLNSSRATVSQVSRSTYKLTGWSARIINDLPQEVITTPEISSRLQSKHTQLQQEIHNDNPATRAMILEAIMTNNLRAVSDGSFNKRMKKGTAGYVIENNERDFMIQGKLIVAGNDADQCSHRSELMGVLGVIEYINMVCIEGGIQQGTINVACDGEGAIRILQDIKDWVIKTTSKHFDILTSIHHSLRLSPITWHFQHVKGHQDDAKDYSELNRWEQLNVHADRIAKNYMGTILNDNRNVSCSLPFDTCIISIPNQHNEQPLRVVSSLQKLLIKEISRINLRQYWMDKGKFPRRLEPYIDWNVVHRAHNSLKPSRSRWISKWITGICGVGKMLKLYKWQTHSRCPRCQTEDEDTVYVLQCPDTLATSTWNHEMNNLHTWILQNNGEPNMAEAIVENMKAWRCHSAYPTTRYDSHLLRSSITQQDQIGWQQFMEGFIHVDWQRHQAHHLDSIGSQKSSTVWMAKLLGKIWEIIWTMWEHRNSQLHDGGNAIHQYELQEIDNEIREEFLTGLDTLPQQRYQHLFRGNIQQRLSDSILLKKMWLSSVWSARDKYRPTRARERSSIAQAFFRRWQGRLAPTEDADENGNN